MSNIEKLCNNISNYLGDELSLDSNKRAVVNYGFFAIIQMGISILMVLIFGLIFNVWVEALIISFTISILRKSSGGVHSSSPMGCAIIGTVVGVGMGLICQQVNIVPIILLGCGVIIFTWAYFIINKLAPVDSKAKPIRKLEKRIRLKKNSKIILFMYLIIILLGFILYYFFHNEILLVYILSMYIGIVWQVFSLTNLGHKVLAILDVFFK